MTDTKNMQKHFLVMQGTDENESYDNCAPYCDDQQIQHGKTGVDTQNECVEK